MASKTDSAAGGPEDFESIIAFYRPKIYRFVLASLRDEDAADTLTQDCFFKAHKTWSTFRHECSVNTWLMQIAVNLVRDHVRNRRFQFWSRTQRRSAPLEAVSDWFAAREHSPEARALLKEQVNAVWDAAGQLPERQRTVFLLRFVEDMDILEIAAATGLKEGTVKAHLFRALASVRERMGVRT